MGQVGQRGRSVGVLRESGGSGESMSGSKVAISGSGSRVGSIGRARQHATAGHCLPPPVPVSEGVRSGFQAWNSPERSEEPQP